MPEIDIGSFLQTLDKDRDLWWPNKYRVACFSQFIPAKVEKILRKSQPQIREKLRKLTLRKKGFSLIKTRCTRFLGSFFRPVLQLFHLFHDFSTETFLGLSQLACSGLRSTAVLHRQTNNTPVCIILKFLFIYEDFSRSKSMTV